MENLSRGKLFPGLPTLDGMLYLYFGTSCRTAGKSVLSGPWVAESQWESEGGRGHENVWLSVEWHPGWDSPVSGRESDWRLLVPGQGGEGSGVVGIPKGRGNSGYRSAGGALVPAGGDLISCGIHGEVGSNG